MIDILCIRFVFTPFFSDQASLERGASQEDDREQEQVEQRRRERRDDREDPAGRTNGHGHRGGGGSYREPPGSHLGGGSLASLLSKPDVLAAVSMITQISQGGGIGFGQVSRSFSTSF